VVLSRVQPAWQGGDSRLAKGGKPMTVAATEAHR
jgi:hypothetical protein